MRAGGRQRAAGCTTHTLLSSQRHSSNSNPVYTYLPPNRYVDSRGRTHCGIIYCLSRNEAETVAAKLADLPQPRTARNGGRLQVT